MRASVCRPEAGTHILHDLALVADADTMPMCVSEVCVQTVYWEGQDFVSRDFVSRLCGNSVC